MEEFENYEDIIEQEREENSRLRSELKTEWNLANNHFVRYTEKTSDLGRKLIFGLIGTIWFIIYNKTDGVIFQSDWFAISISFAFAYLIIDYLHYFLGTIISYYIRKGARVCNKSSNDEMKKELEKDYYRKKLHYLFYSKFVILFFTVFFFILGFIDLLV